MKILVFNCGSSSIKYQLYEMPEGRILAKGLISRIGEFQGEARQRSGGNDVTVSEGIPDHEAAIAVMERLLTGEGGPLRSLSEIGACGHRVVHGGEGYTGSALVDADLIAAVEAVSDLAPLHNPPNLTGIREAGKRLGAVPQVACFDTAFHGTVPEVAYRYALPEEIYAKYRIRRYGFHGTSHRYVARAAAAMLGRGKYEVNLITCHLGNGCSMAAVRGGRSVDTSMGLTPLEGLVMGTRTGDFDPAILLYLGRKGYSAEQLDKLCNKQSGLLGISGVSNDVRDLEQRAAAGHQPARLALDIFAYRVRKYIGAYLAVLDGACDAVVFTGGIGENAVAMRERMAGGLDRLGLCLNADRNAAVEGGIAGDISREGSPVRILVIPTDEEKAIAADTYAIVTGAAG